MFIPDPSILKIVAGFLADPPAETTARHSGMVRRTKARNPSPQANVCGTLVGGACQSISVREYGFRLALRAPWNDNRQVERLTPAPAIPLPPPCAAPVSARPAGLRDHRHRSPGWQALP